jgi:two-component system, sensor histidine kinase and response regulator
MARAELRPLVEHEHLPSPELMLICMTNLLATTEERVYFKDLLSRFLFVSEGWIAAYAPGRSAEELVGKTDFDVFSDHHAATALADEQRIIQTGEPIVGKVERETYHGRPDAWVSSTKMPLRDSHGAIIGTFGISRDVTAQMRAESALARQALPLSAHNERLRELDRLKDEFISLISHELRTPLTSILGYLELLRDSHGRGPETDHFVEVIDRNAQRLVRLVGDLLSLAGIQAGEMAIGFREADLADVVSGAIEKVRAEASRKHIDLTLSASAIPPFTMDPVRIAQLAGHLLANAVKFTPPGGKVEVRLRKRGDQAVITVGDTGIGIPAADRQRIFERFYRTDAVTRQAFPGTGLGLTITKAIVAAHHGTITVDSRVGQGSTFKVCLPLRPLAAPSAHEPALR